jgi:tyrosine-protein phosphatase YwqE
LLGRSANPILESSLLRELKDMDCRLQGNLGSFSGFYGSAIRKQAECLQAADFYDCFGTDAHHSRQIRALDFGPGTPLG